MQRTQGHAGAGRIRRPSSFAAPALLASAVCLAACGWPSEQREAFRRDKCWCPEEAKTRPPDPNLAAMIQGNTGPVVWIDREAIQVLLEAGYRLATPTERAAAFAEFQRERGDAAAIRAICEPFCSCQLVAAEKHYGSYGELTTGKDEVRHANYAASVSSCLCSLASTHSACKRTAH
jgi:hypothetical protein